MTFDQAMALQVLEGHTDVSPEAWYVALVAAHAVNTGELRVPDEYLFSIDPPNPDIMSLFAQQMPPQLAAERLFSTRHLRSASMSTQSPSVNATDYARSLGITQAMVKAAAKPGGMFVFTGLEPDDGVCSLAECEPDGYRVLPPSRGVDANWHVTDHGDTKVAHCFGFAHDASQGEQFARRIAACLNLLVGVPTEQIERWARPDADPQA